MAGRMRVRGRGSSCWGLGELSGGGCSCGCLGRVVSWVVFSRLLPGPGGLGLPAFPFPKPRGSLLHSSTLELSLELPTLHAQLAIMTPKRLPPLYALCSLLIAHCSLLLHYPLPPCRAPCAPSLLALSRSLLGSTSPHHPEPQSPLSRRINSPTWFRRCRHGSSTCGHWRRQLRTSICRRRQ